MSRLAGVLVVVVAAACVGGANAPDTNVTLTVNAGANRRAINPHIYGVANATTAALSDLNVPLNRYGGNNTSRYNWQANADNRGRDWYFESVPQPGYAPGASVSGLIADTRAAGGEPMITIPIIGWVARLGPNRARLASFSQAKYGPQTARDPESFADAGNGILQSSGRAVAHNDPADANVPNTPTLQRQWVEAMVKQWGGASRGGVRYYLLDNEHSLWHDTHRDVQPAGATMEDVRDRMVAYASAIKAADPGAQVAGPEEWGWNGYFFSGSDQQYGHRHGWSRLPDREAHGGADYLPWLLNQLRLDGRHLLDVFTVHYYPDAGEFSDTVTTDMQLRRNRSTRALWDPTYVHEGWIKDRVTLIPRLRHWVNTYYEPGTPIGITEYNWGAEEHINGATAQADVLGIFGREGVDLAARWATPAASSPTYNAIKLYRNYDGRKSAFGDISVAAGDADPDCVAVFAAERTSDGALTVMVIAKSLAGHTRVNLRVSHFSPAGSAEAYQLTSANAIVRLNDLRIADGRMAFTVPAQSLTLLVLPRVAEGARLPAAPALTPSLR